MLPALISVSLTLDEGSDTTDVSDIMDDPSYELRPSSVLAESSYFT